MEKGLPGLGPLRRALKLNQSDVSRASGVSAEFVRLLEGGLADCAQEVLRKIARALSCTPADLLTELSETQIAELEANYWRNKMEEAERRATAGKASKKKRAS